ncbi:hypothetical protein KAI65_04185 [Candidatus Parcubacteria bacterium]|nr:hypothetical protein [Candidatus Parcubacteria bacterium]
MKNKIKHLFILLCLIVILILPYFVFAQTAPLDSLKKVQEAGSGYEKIIDDNVDGNNLVANAGKIVQAFLSLLGIIFLVLMLYGGYSWMTAAGDQGKVERAQNTIRRAIIGIIITIGSYAITQFVLVKLLDHNV